MSFHKIALAIASLGLAASAMAAPVNVNVNPGDAIQSFSANLGDGPVYQQVFFNLAAGYTYDLSITLSSGYITQGGGLVSGFDPAGINFQGTAFAYNTTVSSSFVLGGLTYNSTTDNAAFNVFNLGGGSWEMVLNGQTAGSGVLTGSVDVKRATAITPVPEPETYAMMLAGLGVMGFIARRRKAA